MGGGGLEVVSLDVFVVRSSGGFLRVRLRLIGTVSGVACGSWGDGARIRVHRNERPLIP